MEHARQQPQEQSHKQPKYMVIFVVLGALTLLEVWVASWEFNKATLIIILVGLAIWKAALVAMYYMHLKFEPPRLVLMVLAPLPLAFLLVLAVLTEF